MTTPAETIIAEMAEKLARALFDCGLADLDDAEGWARREVLLQGSRACWSVITRRCDAALEAAEGRSDMPTSKARAAAYRRGMLRAAEIVDAKVEDEIAGAYAGWQQRARILQLCASAIRAEAGEEQSHD